MEILTNLEGKPIMPKDTEKPWEGICCEACWNAKGKRCRCSCGGAFHGIGYANGQRRKRVSRKEFDTGDPVLTSSQAKYFEGAIQKNNCVSCDEDLTAIPIKHYDHSGGWKVDDIEKLQWLYKICPKCGYQNALWKLGVPRQ